MEPQGQGLAAQGAQQGQQQQLQQMLQQVIQMLMQGANPDDLIKQGVPPEVVQQAIQIIQQQQGQPQSSDGDVDPQQAGLAAQGMQ